MIFKRFKPLTALFIVLVHAVAGYAVWKIFHGGFPPAAWGTFVLMWAVTVLSITVVYHRYMTHRAFTVPSPFFEKILYTLPTMAFQGEGIWWDETHSRHHAYADMEGDPHRPTEFGGGLKGFLWAHVGWIFFELAPVPSPAYRPPPHFQQSAGLRWQKRYYLPLGILLSFGIPYLLASWGGLVLAGFFRLALCWNLAWSVNSFCHTIGGRAKDSMGRRMQTRRARNFPLHCVLNAGAILSGGEFWHANHHARPYSAFLGWKPSQFDPGGWLVRAGRAAGFFRNVELPNV